MRKKLRYNLFFFFLLLFLLLGASSVLALEINYPRVPGAVPPQDFLITAPAEDILSLYAKYLVNLCIWAAGIIAFAGLVYGGVLYLISTGKPDRMASAKNQISAAFFGLLLLFGSYLVLNILSPELTVLKIPPLQEIELIEKEDVPPPSLATVYSSIHVELPFGRIIERIFETYISDLPDSVDRTPRITRIKENVSKTLEIAEKLKENSEKIKDYSDDCQCSQTRPCCEISNPGPGCKDNACYSKLGTTSDPCKKVRNEIEKLEQDNLKQIDLLKTEQKKTIDEIKDLKIELNKLERAEGFINACPFAFKNSYSQFLSLKQSYEEGEGIVREINFWDDIIVLYINKQGEQVTDWATFLCTIGGNILPTTRALFEGEQKMEEVVVKETPKACSSEIPAGEIIDRTIRTTRLLIARLEKLVVLDKTMIDAIDEMQILVSQCSSQRCYSYCYETSEGACIKRAGDASQYPEGPCPKSEIKKQVEEIQKIQKEINKIITETKKEEIGIIPLIDPDDPDSVVSRILTELDKIQKLESGIRGIRYPLQVCGTEEYGETLLTCQKAFWKIDPEGRVIRTCCMDEPVFQECLEECYLEAGVENYKVCLQNCLNQKADEAETKGIPRPEEIARCRHLLNFFCCVK